MLGSRLKTLRETKDLTQEKLATLAGLRRTDVCKLETGVLKGTKSETKRALALALGVDFDTFDQYLAGTIELAAVMASRPRRARKAA